MPAGRRVPPEAPPTPEIAEPPYYLADEDLFGAYDPASGVMPAPVVRAGSRVSPDEVERHGWGGKVRVPDQFKDVLVTPAPPADKTANVAGEE